MYCCHLYGNHAAPICTHNQTIVFGSFHNDTPYNASADIVQMLAKAEDPVNDPLQ
jgi:hypothetical protein